MKYPLLILLISFLWIGDVSSGERGFITPSLKDKCPVCGMFVKKYPDWTGQIVFKDGSYAVFDGAKDMFKFYHNIGKYAPSRRQSDIASIYVTDYYTLEITDGFKANYVTGSDVYGPMGKELIPFEKLTDAKEFMKDHKGRAVMRFIDISPDHLKGLD